MLKRACLAFLATALLAGCGAGTRAGTAVPVRAAGPHFAGVAAVPAPAGFLVAFDSAAARISWRDVVSRAVRTDVVYLGELHDDPATHELELATLRTLAEEAGRPVALSLEMFEADVQGLLNSYLAGAIGEQEFLAGSRPWPNYATDYRPLIEYAKASRIPVIASNVPRRLASLVAKGGLPALAGLPDSERRWAAIPDRCPADAYWEEFKKFGHPGMDPADLWKWYEAQCLKDETMARSIARTARPSRPLVLHVNGAFHSDKALGVPVRVDKLAPGLPRTLTTVRPTSAPSPSFPGELAGVADVAILVKAPAAGPMPSRRLQLDF